MYLYSDTGLPPGHLLSRQKILMNNDRRGKSGEHCILEGNNNVPRTSQLCKMLLLFGQELYKQEIYAGYG